MGRAHLISSRAALYGFKRIEAIEASRHLGFAISTLAVMVIAVSAVLLASFFI